MGTKYLYIDDESIDRSEGISKHLTTNPEILDIDIEQPKTWNEQIKSLIRSQALNNYDGILLDLKLEFSDDDDNEVKYFGSDLAQNIRTAIKSGKLNDLPILLCTTDNFLKTYFDKTSSDLFDKRYLKDKNFEDENTVTEFIAFATAYKALNNSLTLKEALSAKEFSNDELVTAEVIFNDYKTSHEKMHFMFHHIVDVPGMLIKEDLLSIRLGIEREQSSDWEKLKSEHLSKFKYQGILSDAFPRWWQAGLNHWWKDKFKKSLKTLSASERVDMLKQAFKLDNLKPYKIPEHHKYETFWYKCRISSYPLETADGLRTIEMPYYAWQEPSYISMAYIMSDERNAREIKKLLGGYEQKIFDSITEKQRN